ncbi:MAG TPA: alpha/beta fold hydrolase [Gammaproteobacteria bacterium]|nr:alpha/beta fold hydrolase [Gammaproteobacteria bacterium]
MRIIVSFFLLLTLLLSGCATLSIPEDNWFHPAPSELSSKKLAAANLPEGYRLVSEFFSAKDGTRLHGLLVTAPSATVTVLYFGGDSFSIGKAGIEVARRMAALGVNGFLVDYRGYGLSDGKPTLNKVKSDAVAAYDYVKTLPKLKSQPIIVHGFSMGSFVAASLACKRPVDGLVLESTATTVKAWAKRQIPWYYKPFVTLQIAPSLQKENNIERVQKYSGPLLILAGEADQTTPQDMSHTLIAKSATPDRYKALVVVPKARHGEVLARPASAPVYHQYRKFIDEAQTFSKKN